jgi:16S rRNA (cytosine1402-N4)-methyltransferase
MLTIFWHNSQNHLKIGIEFKMKDLIDLLEREELEEKLDHIPVMRNDMLKYLAPRDGAVYIDATFGAGGYTKAILDSANCTVIGIDQDPDVAPFVSAIQEKYTSRFRFAQANFDRIPFVLREMGIPKVDGVVFDFGVSSMQLDRGERGFSFMYDGPLDMRMNREGHNATEFLNSASEEEIADVIYKYGEEYDARKIARRIVAERKIGIIETTAKLASIVRSAIGYRKSAIDLSTKTFQAIRIYINDELGAIERMLEDIDQLLNPAGKLITVSFHSLEDSIIKQYLKERSEKRVSRSKYSRAPLESSGAIYNLLTKKAIKPAIEEVLYNSRSRSAKLRAAEKI